jgi:hypothetical protein
MLPIVFAVQASTSIACDGLRQFPSLPLQCQCNAKHCWLGLLRCGGEELAWLRRAGRARGTAHDFSLLCSAFEESGRCDVCQEKAFR